MFYLIFAAVLIVSFIIGATGWAQIIGSYQNRNTDKVWFVRAVIWLAVLVALFFVVYIFYRNYTWAYVIALIFGFLFCFRKQK